MIKYIYISNQAAYRTAATSKDPAWFTSIKDSTDRIQETREHSLVDALAAVATTLEPAAFDALLRSLAAMRSATR